jgi:hypothetical protein
MEFAGGGMSVVRPRAGGTMKSNVVGGHVGLSGHGTQSGRGRQLFFGFAVKSLARLGYSGTGGSCKLPPVVTQDYR